LLVRSAEIKLLLDRFVLIREHLLFKKPLYYFFHLLNLTMTPPWRWLAKSKIRVKSATIRVSTLGGLPSIIFRKVEVLLYLNKFYILYFASMNDMLEHILDSVKNYIIDKTN